MTSSNDNALDLNDQLDSDSVADSAQSSITTKSTSYVKRLDSIDWVRGFVMVLMALDHVRDYFSSSVMDPMSQPNIDASLFITRWITHLCAPAFVLLAGVSIGLMAKRKKKSELTIFLLTRGLWLIFLEMTVIAFGWEFNLNASPFAFALQVIWALGVSMIAMSFLIRLPAKIILLIGLLIIFSGDVLDLIMPVATWNDPEPLWMSLHRQIIWNVSGTSIFVFYPVLAWIGVIACGYSLAEIFQWEENRRKRFLLRLGCGLIVFFFIVRGFDYFGDPNHWENQALLSQTIMDFFNLSKYPPSLLYLSATLGIILLLLAVVESIKTPIHNVFVTIGRVPLFYYIGHIYLIHFSVMITGLFFGLSASDWMVSVINKPAGFGFSLPVVYCVWIAIVAALYPATVWFSKVKAKRKDWWLSYL